MHPRRTTSWCRRAPRGGSRRPEGLALFLVPRDRAGLRLLPFATQSGGRAADLQLTDVRVEGAAVIGPARGGALGPARARRRCRRRGAVRGSRGYRPRAEPGDARLPQEPQAVWRTDRGVPGAAAPHGGHVYRRGADPLHGDHRRGQCRVISDAGARRRAISGAKAYIGQAARFVGQQAVQLHGAMGMVDDLIVSHYFKRLTMIDMTLGDADFHFARFSDAARAIRRRQSAEPTAWFHFSTIRGRYGKVQPATAGLRSVPDCAGRASPSSSRGYLRVPGWPAFVALVLFFIEHMDVKKVPAILVGALVGIASAARRAADHRSRWRGSLGPHGDSSPTFCSRCI